MSQSYDVFYWRKFASLAENGSKQLNALQMSAFGVKRTWAGAVANVRF